MGLFLICQLSQLHRLLSEAFWTYILLILGCAGLCVWMGGFVL